MKITVLSGDGIGPEITDAALIVLRSIGDLYGIEIETQTFDIGGVAIDNHGEPFPAETAEACKNSDAVLLGAVGDPKFDDLLPEKRPEIGLLRLRQALGGFANLRPAKAFDALMDSSPLRPERFAGTDMVIVRELLGGLYFGEPRGVDAQAGFNTMRYSKPEIERVARTAFEIAAGRRAKVTSVDKANVLETSQLWRRTVNEVAQDFPEIEVEHLFVDACAMMLVTEPSRFDVIVTENMFGDILSDEAAVLTGSLGMLASATIGGSVDLFEPVHGSAPDIAGKNIANPIGMIASAAMLLRHTAKNEPAATAIESAILRFLDEGHRTADIAATHETKTVGTIETGEMIAEFAMDAANLTLAFHGV